MPQRLAGLGTVDARMLHLALDPDQLGLLALRHPDIGLREDRDDVVRYDRQILAGSCSLTSLPRSNGISVVFSVTGSMRSITAYDQSISGAIRDTSFR